MQKVTRASRAGDVAIQGRVHAMLTDPEQWLAFCRQLLAGGWHPGGSAPHGNRRIERESVFYYWRLRGATQEDVGQRWWELTGEWASSHRVVFNSQSREGVAFSSTFLDDMLIGKLRPPSGIPDTPPAGADPRRNPFPPMVRSGPLAPASVQAEPELVLAWIEWLPDPRAEDVDRFIVRRAERRRRRPKI